MMLSSFLEMKVQKGSNGQKTRKSDNSDTRSPGRLSKANTTMAIPEKRHNATARVDF
jgi:hypothetical protein